MGSSLSRTPTEHGIVNNWDDTQKNRHYTFFNALHVAPEEHPVLLTDAPANCDTNRWMMAQVMFETFHVSAMFVWLDVTPCLFGAGSTNGVVLDSGDGVTSASTSPMASRSCTRSR